MGAHTGTKESSRNLTCLHVLSPECLRDFLVSTALSVAFFSYSSMLTSDLFRKPGLILLNHNLKQFTVSHLQFLHISPKVREDLALAVCTLPTSPSMTKVNVSSIPRDALHVNKVTQACGWADACTGGIEGAPSLGNLLVESLSPSRHHGLQALYLHYPTFTQHCEGTYMLNK